MKNINKNNELLKKIKEYWADKKNKEKQSEKVEYFQKHPEAKLISNYLNHNGMIRVIRMEKRKNKEQWTQN